MDTSYIVFSVLAVAIIYFVVIKPLFLSKVEDYIPPHNPSDSSHEIFQNIETVNEIMNMMADLKLDFESDKITHEQYDNSMLQLKKDLVAAKKHHID
mgnify:CR=1 FL=1